MLYAKITGTGSYLPKKILTNVELEKTIETNDAWIQERTGIKSRHIASDDETTSTMGVAAAQNALAAAQLEPKDIEMIIVATCTPAQFFPSCACTIQHALGASAGIPAFDVQAACSGFVYALSIADQYIKNGSVKRVLIIGSEIMSRVLDWQDRSTCILFGDGAGAVILEASKNPGVLGTYIGADGSQKDLLYLNNIIAGQKHGSENSKVPYLKMQGNPIFRLAVNILKKIASEALLKHQPEITQLDWLVPHQANIRIIQATAEKLNLPMDKVIVTLENQGNTSSASIPLALDEGIRSKRILPGHTLLLEAFGGGLTWGSALVKY